METPATILDTLAALSSHCRNTKLSWDKRLNLVLKEIVRSLNVDKASIMMRQGRAHLAVRASTRPEIVGVLVPLNSQSPSAWVVKNKAPLYVDEENPADVSLKEARYTKRAFFSVPLMIKNRVIGVLNITEKKNDDHLSEAERKLAIELCARFITALEMERMADLLRKRERDLREKNKKLKEFERVKEDLFNMLVHDLKGPISELTCLHGILSEGVRGENQTVVRAAQAACGGLSQMVSNLLDVVQLEEGKLPLKPEPIAPGPFLKEVLSGLAALAWVKDIVFTFQPFASAGVGTLAADKALLRRVLANLLTNAIRYSPPGDRVEAGFLYPSASEIAFFIKDNGPGVPDELKERIFDKFVRVESRRDERSFSTGLGLAFCKLAVDAHGGRIRVEDAAPVGARFFFTLPLKSSR
ncbi:MAG: GAF domain-containing sensor histidine kinase [Deltaproteobacteria bacterium]|nr:GAF domain-containing sensor histidine kinase [Deltaproteobacteria bacterium]